MGSKQKSTVDFIDNNEHAVTSRHIKRNKFISRPAIQTRDISKNRKVKVREIKLKMIINQIYEIG